jgi:hypothetical protein
MSILFIIDNSYSITHYLDYYVDTVNGILKSQYELCKDSKVTIVTFNEYPFFLYVNEDISKVNPINKGIIKPNVSTSLYDCVTYILDSLEKSTIDLVIILTDGQDTASLDKTKEDLGKSISRYKKKGSKFIFIGNSEDSVKEGKEIGCNTCILYSTTQNSFSSIIKVVHDIFKTKTVKDDVIDISDCFNKMKI